MNPQSVRRSRRIAALGMLLALSLLFMQWLGYAHSLAHAGIQTELENVTATQGDVFGHAKSASACAALDAVSLGSGLPTALPVLLSPTTTNAPVALPLRAGWHRLFSAHFSSRAPPLNA